MGIDGEDEVWDKGWIIYGILFSPQIADTSVGGLNMSRPNHTRMDP